MEIFLIGVTLYLIASLFDTANNKPGCLYLLAIPLAIITLPFKMACDIVVSGQRRSRYRGRSGRRRRR